MSRLLVIGRGARRQVEFEERDIPVALIGMELAGFYALGGFIETGTAYGTQIAASLSFLWRGEKRPVVGAVVPLVGLPPLALPAGFLSASHRPSQGAPTPIRPYPAFSALPPAARIPRAPKSGSQPGGEQS